MTADRVARFENAEPAPESWGGGLREALAEALSTTTTCHGEVWPSEFHYRQVDALLPVVTAYAEQRARERAAEELRAAAANWPRPHAAWLLERADALTAGDRMGQR